MTTSNLQVTCLLQFSRNFRCVLTSMILFFNNCATNAAHPCLPVVSELLKISGYNKTNDIAHIVAGYAEEDTVWEAKSKKYYACAFRCGWTTSGNVVIHNRDGNEIRRIKINYPKAITFSPSGDSIIVMYQNDLSLFKSSSCIVKVVSLEDGICVEYYPSKSMGWGKSSRAIEHWPDLSTACIEKFYIDASGWLKVELAVKSGCYDDEAEEIRCLMEPGFIESSSRKLQDKRDSIKWWNEKVFSCAKRRRLVS